MCLVLSKYKCVKCVYLMDIKSVCKLQTCAGLGEDAQEVIDLRGHTVYLIRFSHDSLPNGRGEDEQID
jgi:hypothetical protein